MKHLIYMVASLSCGVIAAHYWQQSKLVAAALAAAAGVFFVVRLVTTTRDAASVPPRPVSRSDARRELEEMLVPLRRNRAWWRLGFIGLGVGGAVGLAANPPLGIALLVSALFPGVMFHRNHKAVRMIEDGLSR